VERNPSNGALNLIEKIITPAAPFTKGKATEGTNKQNKLSNVQRLNKEK